MLDQVTKSPLKSIGVLGGLGALSTSTLNAFGIQIVPGSHADALITVVFVAVGIWGRLRATQKLSLGAATPSDPG